MKHFKPAIITQERNQQNGYRMQCMDSDGTIHSLGGNFQKLGTEGWVGYYSSSVSHGAYVFTTSRDEAENLDRLRGESLGEPQQKTPPHQCVPWRGREAEGRQVGACVRCGKQTHE